MLLTGGGRGNLQNREDYDYWSFSGRAGDILSVAVEVPGNPGASQLFYDILRPDGTRLTYFYANSYNGWGQSSPVSLPMDGTYSVAVSYNYDYWGEYRLRVTLARGGVQMESEDNNAISQADAPVLELAGGERAGRVAGYVGVGDSNGDYYFLGNQTVGTQITLGLTKPLSSGLSWVMEVYKGDGTKVAEGLADQTPLAHTVDADGAYYARVRAAGNAGLLSQYVLAIELVDGVAPTITACSLPGEGTESFGIVDRFTVGFSEDMKAGTVNAGANYDLRSSGVDGVFGTGDDAVYAVATSPGYSSGLSASYLITDGPLQAGGYRLTIGTGLQDVSDNHLGAEYVRQFAVSGVSGYVLENRSNGGIAVGTSLSMEAVGTPDGSVVYGGYFGGSGGSWYPYDMGLGDFNEDGELDVVTANHSSRSVGVFLGSGDGRFGSGVAYGVGSSGNPIGVGVGDVNGDGHMDVVVAEWSSSNVDVLLGEGDGTLGVATSLAVGSNPRDAVVADLDGGGRAEIVVANYSSSSVSVLRRKGDDSGYERQDLGVGSNPQGLAVGDVDGDGDLDIVTANRGSDNISVLLNDGTGSFAGAVAYAAGDGPVDVGLGEMDGDGVLDAVVLDYDGRSVSVLKGNGDGTFGGAVVYGGLGSEPYHMALGDWSGDGRPDVAVAVYSGNDLALYMNEGGGVLGGVLTYQASYNPIGVVSGDVSGDGLADVVTCNYTSSSGNYVTVWLGGMERRLVEDPPGMLWTGWGGELAEPGGLRLLEFQREGGGHIECGGGGAWESGGEPVILRHFEAGRDAADVFLCEQLQRVGAVESCEFADGRDVQCGGVGATTTITGGVPVACDIGAGRGADGERDNNAISQADAPVLELAGGAGRGGLPGMLGWAIRTGTITFWGTRRWGRSRWVPTKPLSSGLSWVMEVYKGDGTKVAEGLADQTPLAHTVDADGAYYARVRAAGNADCSQYVLAIELVDGVAPTITACSLPGEGTESFGIVDRFAAGSARHEGWDGERWGEP